MFRYLYRFDISWRKILISCSWHQYHGMIQLHNDYSHSTGSMYMAWVSASSCHPILSMEKYQETSQIIWLCPIPWEISKDESYDLKVSYSLRNIKIRFRWFECVIILVRNIERRVIWFKRVLFIKNYLNTSQMIWMCPNPWEISKDGSDDLTVSSSLQAGSRNWYASSLYYMSGWVTRYSMISDSGWTWQWVNESS